MELVEIHVVGAQAAQAGLQGGGDVGAVEPHPSGAQVGHPVPGAGDLGCQHQPIDEVDAGR